MNQLEIKLLKSSSLVEKPKWTSFVAKYPHGSFFHTPDANEIYKTLGKLGFIALDNDSFRVVVQGIR